MKKTWIIWKRLDFMDMFMILVLIMMLLYLMIYYCRHSQVFDEREWYKLKKH